MRKLVVLYVIVTTFLKSTAWSSSLDSSSVSAAIGYRLIEVRRKQALAQRVHARLVL